MKSLLVLKLMGHSCGVSGDSYYRPADKEVIGKYKKIIPYLTVSKELRQKAEMRALEKSHDEGIAKVELELMKERDARRGLEEQLREQGEIIKQLPGLLEEMKKLRKRELASKSR
jgi:hypothetical protein